MGLSLDVHPLSDIHSFENVVSIENHAFEGCTNLSVLPESTTLRSVGDCAFKNCTSLVKIPSYDNLATIGNETFANLNLLTDIGELNNLKSIGEKAFNGCSSIKSLNLPVSLTSIGQGAFADCYSINSVSMPFDATKTFYDIFGSQTEYEGSIAITLHDETIVYVPQALNSIHIKGNGGLAAYAFENAKHITSIIIDEGVLSIGNNAFENCTALTELDLPESIISLGNDFLKGCSGLLSLKLPFVKSYIGLHFSTSVPEDVTDDFYTAQENSHTYYIPNLLTDLTIKSGEINSYACANLSKVVTLTVGDSVTSIGNGAFRGFSSLTEIRLPFVGKSESDTGDCRTFGYIFGYDYSSSSYYGSYKTSGSQGMTFQCKSGGYYRCFYVPQSLRKVTIAKQTSIPSNAFYNCDLLEEIHLVFSYTAGENAFTNCTATIYTDVVPTSSSVYDRGGASSSYHAGEGTLSDPYQIFSCNEFLYFVQNVNDGNDFEGKYFVLTSNLDFGNVQISNITKTFKGTFVGNRHIIKNLSITDVEGTSIGLFGVFEGEMKNVGFENVSLGITTTDEQSHYFGSIFGELTGSIENVYVKGSLTTFSKKDSYIGGLVGHNDGTIKNCYSDVTITSTSVSGKSYVGGLVGLNDTSMEGSFAVGNASSHGYAQAFSYIGGLVGEVGEKSTIENCYRYEKQTLTRSTVSGDVTNEYGDTAPLVDIIEYCKSNWDGKVWSYKKELPGF